MKYFIIQVRNINRDYDEYYTTTEQFGYLKIPHSCEVIRFWVYER